MEPFWPAERRGWVRREIEHIGHAAEAVAGAELQPTQLAPNLGGSLVHGWRRGFQIASGLIRGKVALRGGLLRDALTIGLGLNLATGSRQWLQAVGTGNVAIFEPGHDHDAIYETGSVYLALSLPTDLLLAEAEREGVKLSYELLRSGVLDRPMYPSQVALLSFGFGALHRGETPPLPPGQRLEEQAVAALLNHLANGAEIVPQDFGPSSYERIVERARAFIEAHMDGRLSIDGIATAAHASRRTLYRAFLAVLGESPRSYVLKLRLQRIRDELANADESELTITLVSNRWGVAELGRLAARYREMFGELPSETLRRRKGERLGQRSPPLERLPPQTFEPE